LNDLSPTARALRTLDLIQARPGVTAERLGRDLGVSERAARRYVALLREAGIPVESTRGPYGGFRIGRGLRLPPLTFTATEALGLVMAVLDGHHDAADPSTPAGSALAKIVRVLPENVASATDAVRRTAMPAPDHGAARADPATTAALVQACAERRMVRVGYRTEASAWEADVEPWAVVVRHGRWYLVCRVVARDAIRTYRVDRVTAVEPLEARFAPPEDLDPVALLEENLAAGWEYTAEVEIAAPADAVIPVLHRSLGSFEQVAPGLTRLTGTTSNPYWYAEQLVRLPVSYRVLGGPELRFVAAELGQRMLDAARATP
jgi:predicted DNA-binding transcriptional regulator YafY